MAQRQGADEAARLRARMVERQIRARGVRDERVLEAMARVPRHEFVPERLADRAYADHPLPIGYDQTISQPYIVALMSELLALDGSERVLEIGTGSGYQAAILGELAAEVYSIEIVEPLARQAEGVLRRLGYENVQVRAGDGYRGWPEEAPFDAVILTAAPPEVPEPLFEQLAEGGVLVAPVGEVRQDLVLYRKQGDRLTEESVIPVRFVPMTGEAQER
ncbi:MAG: protein-L-isoaspartate(D-aspartate) O-methyltransferase [Thermoanaerobaculia bacterium]|nr:protein-L-isoaspartate(D-aspartate) O-methyltransferase [Thermoanaerobaculia bacterium]